ncbi:MAG: hypothetical protein Q4D54_02090 [Eubacteriales bacterium]|nr:hypothetical protein [Eubacteriales bacterium]
MEMLNPDLASNFERLMEIQSALDDENSRQESLLERMMETELDIEEMSQKSE